MKGFLPLLLLCLFSSSPFQVLGEQASRAQELRVLLLFPELQGDAAAADFNIKGAKMAVARRGLSKQVRLIPVETGESAKEIAQATTDAIEKYHPHVIYGGSTSNAAFVIGDIAEAKRVTFVTSSATHPDITKDKAFVFRTCFDDTQQAAQLANFMKQDRGLSKALILFNSQETYAVGMKSIFQKHFEMLGGKVVKSFSYSSPKDVDETYSNKIKELDFDFIFIPGYQVESGAIISTLIEALNRPLVFVGGDGWGGGRLLPNLLQGSLDYFEGYYVTHWSGSRMTEVNRDFHKELKAQEIPESWYSAVALGFDTMNVILKAYETTLPFPASLRTVRHEGVSGDISFLNNRQTPRKDVFIYRLNKSGSQFVRSAQ